VLTGSCLCKGVAYEVDAVPALLFIAIARLAAKLMGRPFHLLAACRATSFGGRGQGTAIQL